VNNRYHYDLRKFSFAPRIVICLEQLTRNSKFSRYNTFKGRLDKFWQHQDILLYDYKVELTGVGNRSQLDTGKYG